MKVLTKFNIFATIIRSSKWNARHKKGVSVKINVKYIPSHFVGIVGWKPNKFFITRWINKKES